MRVAVVGTGHVGLVTAVCLARLGHEVTGTDTDTAKIRSLQQGRAPFREPDLDALLRQGLDQGRLSFAEDAAQAVAGAQVVFICVGRPPVGLGDRSLSAVEGAARAVAAAAEPGVVVVVKSTVPPGTAARVAQVLAKERPDLGAAVVSNPEFLREGHAVEDTLKPERTVIGSDDERALRMVRELYEGIDARFIQTDPRTAELSKLASNAFLATKISFANALARVAELAGADVTGVSRIMGADPRIGPAFLRAGLGYGGYCLPKDIVTLEQTASRLGYDFGLLRETTRVNEQALDAVARAVEEAVWNLEGKRIALLGLAFKPGTDDVRSAPALALALRLISEGATVTAADPAVGEAAVEPVEGLKLAADPYSCATGAACLVICTDWPEFSEIDLRKLAGVMADPVMIDARNTIDPASARAAGFAYRGVGRAEVPG